MKTKRNMAGEIIIYAETALKHLSNYITEKEHCCIDVDAEYNNVLFSYGVEISEQDVANGVIFLGHDEITFDIDSAMKTSGYGVTKQKIQKHFSIEARITSKEMGMAFEEFSNEIIFPMAIGMAKKINYCITKNKKNNKHIGIFMPILDDVNGGTPMQSLSNNGISIRMICEYDPTFRETSLIFDCLFGCFTIDKK